MESWVPLFDIFLNSAVPESEASEWLQQQSLNPSSPTNPISSTSFLSLLMKPTHAILLKNTFSFPTHQSNRVMFINTLPSMVQSRILSFLSLERQRFCKRELYQLVHILLSEKQGLDFWVERAVRNLLNELSDSNFEWISRLSLDSEEEEIRNEEEDEFDSVPGWLKDIKKLPNSLFLPCSIHLLSKEPNPKPVFGSFREEIMDEEQVVEEIGFDCPRIVSLEPGIQEMAANFKKWIQISESITKTIGLAKDIRQLCLENKGGDYSFSFSVLSLIKPWLANDETASVLISHLSTEIKEVELHFPSQVLCSVILPKLLTLEKPAARLLVTAIIEYCKLHQKAAVEGLLYPLILKKEGINTPMCDVIIKIVKECLHPAHVSAFFQNLLCGEKFERRAIIYLPCHECLISNELVWTESFFSLLQSILNHNILFTQGSVDLIVYQVRLFAEQFSRSLKLGNFVLCLVSKCTSLLKCHKRILIEAVECTDTILTKSILSKLASL